MNNLYKKLIFLTLLPFVLNASSLKEIIEMTLKNNVNIKALNYDVASKKETLKSVSNTLNPTINIGANYTRLDLDTRSTQVGATSVGYLKFGIDLYDGGKNSSIKRQKGFELESTKLGVKASTKEILLQVVTLFYQVKTIDENIMAYKDKSKTLYAQYKREKQKYDIQMVTIDEVLKLQSEYESNRYIVDDLKYQRDYLYQNLSLLAGEKISSVDDSKLPDILNLKYQSSSSIKALQVGLKAANENIAQVTAIKKPKIRFEDSVNVYHYSDYNEGLLKDLPDTQNQLMLSFSLNLYDSSSSSKRQSAILAKMVKKEQLNYAKAKEKMVFDLAIKKLATQKSKVASAKSALDMAVSVYDIILTKFQNGIVDNIAYLDALSKKTINQALYNQALNNYEIAKANYYFSSGVDYKEVLKLKPM
ncbi:MAG: TolC family protein [Epsilonproteobacteria bacterium]|nr:TolC family protein [Campylobacterota bacterium]